MLAVVDRLLGEGRTTVEHHQDWGPEGRVWSDRLEAEALRAQWLLGAGVELEELTAAWRAVEQGYDALGHVLELARTRVVLATVLRARGDLAASREVADLARTTARRLGLTPMLEELRALGSTPVRQSVEPESLTPRETEILALVAQGRSNGEIGKQLFISTKTVSVHVSNILAKLGAAGRTEASAIARRRGLVE